MSLDEKTKIEIHRVFEKQKSNRVKLAHTNSKTRAEKLKKLLTEVMNLQDEICDAVYKDLRKSTEETKLSEVYSVTSELKHAINRLKRWMKPKRVSTPLAHLGSSSTIIYESIGQSLIISPWNFPFQLAIGPLISAIAAGNAVILKPSEKSPHTSELIREIINNLYPENEVKVILGEAELSKELASLPFNHIFFTGSPNTGKIIMKAASAHLAKVTLELGGKSPTIVYKDADVKNTARRIAWGKFMNAGQTCVAPDYLLVHSSIKQKFINTIIFEIKKLYGEGETLKRENNYCRIISLEHLKSIKNMFHEAISNGAKVIYGGQIIPEDNFIEPTILDNVNTELKIMNEEIFGPVLPVISFDNDDEVLTVAERNPNPLAIYIFSNNKRFVKKMLTSIPAGSAMVNNTVVHFTNHSLPFGGIGTSGTGKVHGFYGFKTFSNEKSIMKQSKISTMMFLYPPYNKAKNKLIEIVIKYL